MVYYQLEPVPQSAELGELYIHEMKLLWERLFMEFVSTKIKPPNPPGPRSLLLFLCPPLLFLSITGRLLYLKVEKGHIYFAGEGGGGEGKSGAMRFCIFKWGHLLGGDSV